MSQSPLEEGDGLAEVPPDAVSIRGTPGRDDPAVRVVHRLGEADPFLSMDHRIVERSTLGQGPSQIAAGHRGRKSGEPQALTSQIVAKLLHVPTIRMKQAAAAADAVVYAETVRHLFGLGEEKR